MRIKYLKMLAIAAAAALMIGLGVFANAFLGNPISHYLADRAAKAYLQEKYADTDYYIEEVFYSFKDGKYHAQVLLPDSPDASFGILITMKGEVKSDGFDFYVAQRMNTASRLDMAYRALVDSYFESEDCPYTGDTVIGTLAFRGRDADMQEYPSYALVQEDLVLDQQYDIVQLGAAAGRLIIHLDSNTVTVEEAARIMLDIKNNMDARGIPFRAMDFHLQQPEQYDGGIDILDFPYEDIYEQDMAARVEQASEATREYYARMDKEKETVGR